MTYLSLVWQVVLFCTAVASWITTIYMIDHKAHGTLNMGNFDVLYDKPWIRISPYLVGKILVLQKVASELHPKVRNHGEGPY